MLWISINQNNHPDWDAPDYEEAEEINQMDWENYDEEDNGDSR